MPRGGTHTVRTERENGIVVTFRPSGVAKTGLARSGQANQRHWEEYISAVFRSITENPSRR